MRCRVDIIRCSRALIGDGESLSMSVTEFKF